MAVNFTDGRGNPWEFDPGPPRNRSWLRLFSETPNYRALGQAVMGRDKFRWHFGPMFYRGRLADNNVKVLVIGQEGAQDESLSHRSFTGGTGGRMQHVLNHLGITRSYLFLNTFVYPIFGQYSGTKIRWLAQDASSPIRQHRHNILNYVLTRNNVHLVIAVGTAAKESVQTWVESRGGTCPDGISDLSTCDSHVLHAKTRVLGVRHPGGASSGNLAAIKADFIRAMQQVETWSAADPSWLPADPGANRSNADSFVYDRAPIPFRDFPFGTPWRLGRGSTSSRRKDEQRAIQIFSAGGKFRIPDHALTYSDAANGTKTGYSDEAGDLPYEPPVESYREFDRGPDTSFARLLAGGRTGFAWPDFTALGADAHPSFGHGPIYRGRPREATVIVIADQQSHDDLFMARALTGEAGQRFQNLLAAMGLIRSYLILRVLPIDTLDLGTGTKHTLVDHPKVRNIYSKVIETAAKANNRIKVILAMGPLAQRLVPHVNPTGLPVVELKSWNQSGAAASWRAALTQLSTMTYGKDKGQPSFAFDGTRHQIPRYDLPYGALRWQGSSGNRARKPTLNGQKTPDYFKLFMPKWAFDLAPESLSNAEQSAVDSAPT